MASKTSIKGKEDSLLGRNMHYRRTERRAEGYWLGPGVLLSINSTKAEPYVPAKLQQKVK